MGSGVFVSTGSPFAEFLSQAAENGQGGAVYVGAGYGSWVGSPVIEFICIASVFMLGEYIAVDGKW